MTRTPGRGIRTGLRSRPIAEPEHPFEDNPELLIRNRRRVREARKRVRAQNRPHPLTPSDANGLGQLGESLLAKDRANQSASDEDLDEGTSLSSQDKFSEEVFNRKWGYLPPLDEEATAVIEAIIANPAIAKEFSRISPYNGAEFPLGLQR